MHREFEPTKIDIFRDGKLHKACDIRKSTKAKIVINCQLFNVDHTVCDMKDDGKVVSNDPWNYRGIGWNDRDWEMVTTREWGQYQNFISGVALIYQGSKLNLRPNGKPVYTPDVGRCSGNTVVGKLKNGQTFVYVEKEGVHNLKPEQVQDYLIELYNDQVDFALLLDGGGSSQLSMAGEEYVYSSRPVPTLLCFWYDSTPEERIIEIAQGEIGHAEPHGDDKYIQWYNRETNSHLPLNVAWCACFVSWVCKQVYPEFTPFCSCTQKMRTMKLRKDPQLGDMIFFNWDRSRATSEHVGLVVGITPQEVYTIEGNSGDAVKRRAHPRNKSYILGYCNPLEVKGSNPQPSTPHDPIDPWYQKDLDYLIRLGITDGSNPTPDMIRTWVMLTRTIKHLKGE